MPSLNQAGGSTINAGITCDGCHIVRAMGLSPNLKTLNLNVYWGFPIISGP